jgi:hypothetical protein
MVPLGDRAQVEAFFVCLEIVLILMQYRCMVCAKCPMLSEIIVDAPDGTPGRKANLEIKQDPGRLE